MDKGIKGSNELDLFRLRTAGFRQPQGRSGDWGDPAQDPGGSRCDGNLPPLHDRARRMGEGGPADRAERRRSDADVFGRGKRPFQRREWANGACRARVLA